MKHYFTIKSIKADKKLVDFIEEIKSELSDFFQFNPRYPLIFFMNNRKDMDLIWGKKTEKWFAGAAKNNSIYIFHPEILTKVSSHKKERFWEILKHEYCHIYYTEIVKSHYLFWLNEGLASHISGKKLILQDGSKKNLLNVFKYFNAMDKDGYAIGQYWVEYLLKNFGKKNFYNLSKVSIKK